MKFNSELFPSMNPFLELLVRVLNEMPNENKPKGLRKGFLLAYYDSIKCSVVTEVIGVETIGKFESSTPMVAMAIKAVADTFYYEVNRSKDLLNNNKKISAIKLYRESASVVGLSEDVLFNEAISALWLISTNLPSTKIFNFLNSMEKESFWFEVAKRAEKVQREIAPDNRWLVILSRALMECFTEKTYA